MTVDTGRQAGRQVRNVLAETSKRLEACTGSPRREAEQILAHALGVTRTDLYLSAGELLDDGIAREVERIVEARTAGEPLQYLLGIAGFYGLDLSISEGVLVPRPETEILVERALDILRKMDGEPLVVDLGTGSGAIAVALAANEPRARVIATDISPAALDIARQNAALYAVGRVEFAVGDFFEPLEEFQGEIDLLVSNPPYIPTAELENLPVDVGREPALALDGGPDGLDFHRCIAVVAPAFLKPGGHILVEVGDGQAHLVGRLFSGAGLTDIEATPDLAGIERVISAKRPL